MKDVVVKTTSGQEYVGKRHTNNNVCGVSILRAGECMEPALCDVYKNVRIGKILIQTNDLTGEPEVSFILVFLYINYIYCYCLCLFF